MEPIKDKDVQVCQSNYDDPESMVKAFSGCSKLFLVSTPRIEMDSNDAPPGEGREKHHIAAIKAAQEADVEHVYCTSLAFASDSYTLEAWVENSPLNRQTISWYPNSNTTGYFGIEIHGPFETIPNNERAIFMRNSDYPESLFFKTNENEATRAVIVQPWGEVRYIAQHSLMMKQIV